MIALWRKTDRKVICVGELSDKDAGYEKALMGIDEVKISVVVSTPLDIRIKDYILLEGIEYTLNREPDLLKSSEVEYHYEMVFESPVYNLMDKLYRLELTNQSRFTLNGRLEDFVDLLLQNINHEEFDPGWEKGEILETEFKNLSFDSVSCYEVLAKLANEFSVEYRIDGRRISFMEKIENIRDLKFKQGYGNGLYTLKRQNVDTENTVTRAYVFGSTENLPMKYRDGGYDRLVPADENGKVIPYFENRTEYTKIVERDVFFDDVKPTFLGEVRSVVGKNNRIMTCPDIDFDLNDKDIAIGDQARVNFLTGSLMGVGFKFNYNHARKEITLIEQEDETATVDGDPEYNVLPNPNRKPEVTDKFNFTGIYLPMAYVLGAEKRLAEKGEKWMEVYSKLRVKYNLDVDFHYLYELGETLDVGDVVRIVVEDGEEQQLRITSLKKQLATGQVTCEVSNFLTESWEKKLEGKVQETRSSVDLNRTELLYSINATKDWVGRNFGQLSERMNDGSAIVWDETAHRIKTVRQVPDTVLWDGLKMPEWLDQQVKTTDEVKFKQVIAEELIEQGDERFVDEQVADFLVEETEEFVTPVTLGDLENVDIQVDSVGEEDVVLFRGKGSDKWTLKLLSEIGGGGGSSVQRNVRIVNNLESKNISASKGEPCLLNFTFISQERYSSSDPYEDTGERGLLQISVRSSDKTDYVVVREMHVNSGTPLSVDVAEFLTSGANNVMVKVTGEVTEVTTPAFVYTVTLTALSISADNFKWWTAYMGDVVVPLNIGGNVSKTLYIKLSGADYNESYEVPLGTGVYIETAYNHILPHPGRTGVFSLSVYVANADGSIRTRTVSFNVICVVAGERAKLIAINNVAERATNWSENTLFDYSMYDGDNATTEARFVITRDGQSVFESNENGISVSTKYTLSLPLEIETPDNGDFFILAHIYDNDMELVDPLSLTVNNSLGYSAVAGAVFHVNPRTRSNRQENFRDVINEIDGTAISAVWQGMNWGNDGWVTDVDGNRVLRLMAGSSLSLDHQPFARECARTGKTLEMDYRVDNVTDYSHPILTVSTPSGDSFVGLNVYADEVIMHSQALRNDSVQSLHTFEGRRTRLTLTILPTAYGNPRFNLCILYVNGVKNREFVYEDNDYFAQGGSIVIGSDHADIDLYGIREYDSGLTSQGVLTNYINWLASMEEKARVRLFNDILDGNGSEIDFENTRDQFNVLVFDNTIPSMADQSSRKGNLEVFFADHPEWNVSISNVTGKGQGTSSMKYWIWNTRYQLDKETSVITHADGTTSVKRWQMVPWLPAGQKFTAKKNYASSMQSHKIGSVNSYTDLYREIGLLNEAMQTERYADARVAVYQLPFLCFEKSVNEEGQTVHVFKGLYTFGPDKGDKYTFGFDTDLFPELLSLEGSDNSPLCTLFRVPWHDNVVYNADEEAFQYNNANSWDLGAGEPDRISKFIPAYNIVYQCSPRLRPFEGSPSELNGRVSELRTEPYEYWIARAGDPNQYDVYYFEASQNAFIPSDIGGGTINLVAQLVDLGYGLNRADLTGKTVAQLNELFVAARIRKFRMEAPAYWDIDDTLFFMNNVEFNAGTDERAKNTYPYTFGTVTSRWRWRVDDADTRFDTTNRGLPDKEYGVETHDVDETGASVWNGETNNFFNLMELAFPEERVASMRRMMAAMQALGGLKSGNDLDRIQAFYQKYFFDMAQEYFPHNGYNSDAKYCYENGKLAYISGAYSNDTDPITQSLGDHYLAEQRWITRRILYMMSKYSFGLFSANGTDTITVRAAGNTIRYELTPAMDMYPAIANGTSIIRGARTKAGEVCGMEIELSGTGDQQNAIQGASYLMDIGDWHDKNVQGSMIIQGRMLREIRLGSKTEPVVISISSLTVSNCVSLQKLVLSNIATLSGTLNLMGCTHLQEVYADGTGLSQIKLPTGGGLCRIEFSAYNQYLTLANYPLLTNEGVGLDLCREVITDFFIMKCSQLMPIQLLVDVMNAQATQGEMHALKRIRIVGFEETYNSSDMLDKLAELTDGTYEGLNADGIAGDDPYPVLDGTLNIYANAYQDAIDTLRSKFTRLILNVYGNFYIRFADPIIGDYFIQRNGDGVGVTADQLAAITTLSYNAFQGNTKIISFNEFRYFTGVTVVNVSTFKGCSNLMSIVIPENVIDIKNNAFNGTGLKNIVIPANVKSIEQVAFERSSLQTATFAERTEPIKFGYGIFQNCPDISSASLPDNIAQGSNFEYTFNNCTSLQMLHLPNSPLFTAIQKYMFAGCNSLTEVNMPETVKSIEQNAFSNCSNLKNIVFNEDMKVARNAFVNCTRLSFVLPDKIELDESCFKNTGIESITIHANVSYASASTSIFADCANLTEVTMEEGCKTIPNNMFQNCKKLTEIVFPSTITSIGNSVLWGANLINTITVLPVTPPSLGSNLFFNFQGIMYVPDESLNEYKTATNWSAFASKMRPLTQKPL